MVSARKMTSKTLALAQLASLVVFFVVLYIGSIIVVATSHTSWSRLAAFPFKAQEMNFKTGLWTPLCVMAGAYCGVLILMLWPVRNYKKAWDYICSTSIVYFIIVCAVSRDIPKTVGFYIVFLGMTGITILISTLILFYT